MNEYFKEKDTCTYFRNTMPLFGIQFKLPQVFINNIAENGGNGLLWTLIVERKTLFIVGATFSF